MAAEKKLPKFHVKKRGVWICYAPDNDLQSQVVMLDMLQVFYRTITWKNSQFLLLSEDWTNLGSFPTMFQTHSSARSKCPPTRSKVSSWGILSAAVKTPLSLATSSWFYHVVRTLIHHCQSASGAGVILSGARSHQLPTFIIMEISLSQPDKQNYIFLLQYSWESRTLKKILSNLFSSSMPFSFFGHRLKTKYPFYNMFFFFFTLELSCREV